MKREASDNIKLIKGFYEALSSNDWSAARKVLAPNIEWIEPPVPGLWFGGRHLGADAVFKEVIEPTQGKFDKFQVKMKKFFAIGEHVIAVGSCRGRGKTTRIKLEAATAHVWTLCDGRAVRFEGIHDILEWQVALGLTLVQSNRMAA